MTHRAKHDAPPRNPFSTRGDLNVMLSFSRLEYLFFVTSQLSTAAFRYQLIFSGRCNTRDSTMQFSTLVANLSEKPIMFAACLFQNGYVFATNSVNIF